MVTPRLPHWPATPARRSGRASASTWIAATASVVSVAIACTDGPLARQVPARVVVDHDSVATDAVGESVTLSGMVLDSRGGVILGAIVQWRSSDDRVAMVDSEGTVRTMGDGIAAIILSATGAGTDTTLVRVEQAASGLAFAAPSHSVTALGSVQLPPPVAVDRNGQPMRRRAALVVGDTTVLRLDSAAAGLALRNGTTTVIATIDGLTDTLTVNVVQRAARIIATADTVPIDALFSRRPLPAAAVDANGNVIVQAPIATVMDDSTIARVSGIREIESKANGITAARLSLDGASATIAVHVAQRAVRVDVQGNQPILMLAGVGSVLPLVCTAYDGTNHALSTPPTVRARNGRVTGYTCAGLAAQASGHDTLEISAPGYRVERPIAIALRTIVKRPIGDAVRLDSMPSATGPWAPTARVRPTGEIELYATAYQDADNRGDLHRYVSNDGLRFRYDGVAIRRDGDPCALRGTGIENVAVIPRNDAPGWRMFFAAGTFDCHGWQVFSAVSSDERNWTIEPGIRLSNGGSTPPDAPVTPPWPTGEGMEVDRLPDGEWRMIVSAYERVLPAQDVWQITEWRSSDQIAWRYIGVVLNTRDVPQEARASIYSPTIREVAPRLWRMIFTGDNRRDASGRSRLWTAISTDRTTWQFEGELMGAVGSQLLYSSLAGDRVYFLRRDGTGPNYIAQTRVMMP